VWFEWRLIDASQAEQAAEKNALVVILSEAKNPSRLKTKTKRDSSRKLGAQNDSFLLISAPCEACATQGAHAPQRDAIPRGNLTSQNRFVTDSQDIGASPLCFEFWWRTFRRQCLQVRSHAEVSE